MENQMGLSDLIRGFMEYAVDNGKKSFPALRSPLWHEFLYRLKKELGGKFPVLLVIGEFDWDGPYPKSVYLSEIMSLMGGYGFVVSRLDDARIVLILKREENSFAGQHPEMIAEALKIASEIPEFFNE